MAKKSKRLPALPTNEKERLDWQNFNLLENLLIFCPLQERSVPKESGVHFRIGSKDQGDSVCVLFGIDRKNDPLITERGTVRPDYMAFYASRDICLCTIVEMKGKSGKDLVHGIEQIKTFVEILKEQIRNHLPYFNIKFQGILLTPPNSQIPLKLIERENERGFVILALQYHHKAELFPYVSKANKVSERYRHQDMPRDLGRGLLEIILTEGALPRRVEDAFYTGQFAPEDRQGIFINYALPNDDGYAVLVADNSKAAILVNEKREGTFNNIRKCLNRVGVTAQRKLGIAKMYS